MSLWSMSGAELAREISQPAPVTVLRGGHAGSGLAGVLGQIAALSASDRDELLRAFQAALRPEPRRLGGQTYRNAEEFFPAFDKAREAARAVSGPEWYLDPAVSLKARVPAAWVALKGEMSVWRSPRDVNFPRGEFWPGGVLPTGPDYAERGPLAPEGKIGAMRAKRRVESMCAEYPTMAKHVFALEPTPENIDTAEAA